MNRILLQIGIIILLISILMCFSCSKKDVEELKEVKELGAYEEVSLNWREMAVRGNCLPIELEGVSIIKTIKVADGRLKHLSFLSSTELIFMNPNDELYICDIESGTKRQLVNVFAPDSTFDDEQIFIHNRNEILVFWRAGNAEDLTVAATFINVEDDISWHTDPQNFTSNYDIGGIYFDGADYLIFNQDDSHFIEVLAFNKQDEFDDLSSFQEAEWLYFTIPGDQIFYLLGHTDGPYYSERGDEGYTDVEIWNENYDTGFGKPIVDASDRIIGMNHENTLEGEVGSLVVLERGDEEPEVIDFDLELGLDLWNMFGPPWSGNYRCASDGKTVVFTTTHYLLKYSDGEAKIWHDNLLDYGDNWVIRTTRGSDGNAVEYRDVLIIRSLFTDHDSSHFIMLFGKAIVYGGDEIEVIDLDDPISANIQFTPDFQRACVALADGSIVVLDIQGTPVDQL